MVLTLVLRLAVGDSLRWSFVTFAGVVLLGSSMAVRAALMWTPSSP